MPDTEVAAPSAAETPAPEMSFAQLRKAMGPDAPEAPAVEPEAPAAKVEKPEAKTAQDPEPVSQEAKEEPVSPGVQKRIDKAVKAQREAERKTAELEARLQTTQAAEPAQKQPPAAQQPTTAKPESKDFKTWEEYEEAFVDWKADQRDAARAATTRQQAEAADAQTMTSAWSESEAKAQEAHSDYAETMAGVSQVPVPQHLHVAILKSPQKAELAYALAKSPADVKRIFGLPPHESLMALGEFAAKLTPTKVQAAPATQTALPKPPASLGGSSAPEAVDLDKCDMKTFKREFQKRLKDD